MIIARAVLNRSAGFIHPDGSFHIPPSFSGATDFDLIGRTAVSNGSNCWRIISFSGDSVRELGSHVTSVSAPSEGLFPFQSRGRWGFIDATGTEMLEARFSNPEFAGCGSEVMSFAKGQAAILAPYADIETGATHHIFGLITRNGDWLVEPEPSHLAYGDGSLVTDCRDIHEPGEPPFGFHFRSLGLIKANT